MRCDWMRRQHSKFESEGERMIGQLDHTCYVSEAMEVLMQSAAKAGNILNKFHFIHRPVSTHSPVFFYSQLTKPPNTTYHPGQPPLPSFYIYNIYPPLPSSSFILFIFFTRLALVLPPIPPQPAWRSPCEYPFRLSHHQKNLVKTLFCLPPLPQNSTPHTQHVFQPASVSASACPERQLVVACLCRRYASCRTVSRSSC